jgi:hypothetical protein
MNQVAVMNGHSSNGSNNGLPSVPTTSQQSNGEAAANGQVKTGTASFLFSFLIVKECLKSMVSDPFCF